MKRIPVLMLCMAILLFNVLFPLGAAYTGHGDDKNEFILPSHLTMIEEEAFADTAAEAVVFPDGFLSISDNAFEGARKLSDIYLPETTEYISASAFPAAQALTIHGIDGSYAQEWAETHQVPFAVEDVRNAISRNEKTGSSGTAAYYLFSSALNPGLLITLLRPGAYKHRSRRPQDRPELNPIDYRFP